MFRIVKCDEGKKFNSKPLQEAEIYDTIGTYDYEAFILPEDIVVVDIDDIDPDITTAMIEEFGIKTMYSHTDEGMHLYFRKPKRYKRANEGVCPLGFTVEHKHKECVITFDGVTRQLENEGTIEDLPYILTIDDRMPELLSLSDGDGRYNKMLTMNGYIGKRANKRQILTFINTYVFEEPLKGTKLNLIINSELEDVSTEEDIQSKQEAKKGLIDELIERFKPVRYNNVLFFWDDQEDCWESNIAILQQLLYKQFYGYSSSTIDEYQKHIERLAHIYRGHEIFPIQFKNGYLFKGEWKHGIYEEFTPYMIDYEFLPNAPITPEMDQFFNFITENNPELIQYLFDAFSQVFEVEPNRRNKYPRIHTFLGEGGNGKGMLMRLLKKAVGRQNTSSVKLHKFNDKDELISLKGRLLNISEDENGTVLRDSMMDKIKNVAAADEITIHAKYELAEQVIIFPALFVTSNHAFPTYEKGESVKRRFFWIEFNQALGKQEWLNDEFVEELYSDKALTWFVSQMVHGYFRVRKDGFTECQVINDFTGEYHAINNNIEEYTDEMESSVFKNRAISDCYDEYQQWAKSEHKYEMPLADFKLFICKKYNLKETVGKRSVDVEVDGGYQIKRVSVRMFKEK